MKLLKNTLINKFNLKIFIATNYKQAKCCIIFSPIFSDIVFIFTLIIDNLNF